MSYLRGPLTLPEISRLTSARKAVAPAMDAVQRAPAAAAPASPVAAEAASGMARPLTPAGVTELFLPARPGGALRYRPRIAAQARMDYVDPRVGLDSWRSLSLVVPFGDDGAPSWVAGAVEVKELRGGSEPQADARFADPPAAALREKSYRDWEKSLAAHLYQHGRLQLLRCASLKLASEPGETEGDFRSPEERLAGKVLSTKGIL